MQDVIVSASHTIFPWGGCVPPSSVSPLPSKNTLLNYRATERGGEDKVGERSKSQKYGRGGFKHVARGGKMGAHEQL